MKSITVLALTGTLSLAACDSVEQRGSRYELVLAGDSTLPAVLRRERGCAHRLHGGAVEFDGEGGYRSSYDIRIECPDSTVRLPDIGGKGRFTVRNDTAFFTDSAGASAGTGRLTADSLIVRGPLRQLTYRRR